ncbi:hypothetical protein J3456_11940 [Sulfitobacter sp. NFXS29]|uniref:hypothetical protein n=1 Tax=Sulfitobacter sp. NFXS29 TaxID=2818438 RepID=UPI0032DEA7A5
MKSEAPEKSPKNTRSKEFRYLPADSLNMGFSDNWVKIVFGIDEMDGSTLDLVGIQMTHKTAFLLKNALIKAFENHEEQTGEKFELPESAITEHDPSK